MSSDQYKIIFDGQCQFCLKSIGEIKWLDVFHTCEYVDYHLCEDLSALHPSLNKQNAHQQIHLITPTGKIYGGFYAFRRMTWLMPLLYPFILFLYLPFAGRLGQWVYQWIARRRYLFNSKNVCQDNRCSS